MALQTFKFKIDNFYQKNFEALNYRIALIAAKKWRDQQKPGGNLTPA